METLNKEQLNLFLQQQGKAKIIDILFAALQHRFMNYDIFQCDDKFISLNDKKYDQSYSNKNPTFIKTYIQNKRMPMNKSKIITITYTELLNVFTNPIITK